MIVKCEMTLEEYIRELILMERQYGQEEELYPLIRALLHETVSLEDRLSIRTVASGQTDWSAGRKRKNSRNLLMGFVSFPDLAILSEAYAPSASERTDLYPQAQRMYGCVEAKALGNSILETKKDGTFSVGFGYEDILILADKPGNRKKARFFARCFVESENEKKLGASDRLLKKYKEYGDFSPEKAGVYDRKEWHLCDTTGKFDINRIKAYPSVDIPAGSYPEGFSGKVYMRLARRLVLSVDGKSPDAFWHGKNINNDDLKQLFGELLWYGKVLYTNGLLWEYLELCDTDDGEAKRKMFERCFAPEEGTCETDWIRYMKDRTVTVRFRKFADLSPVFEMVRGDDPETAAGKIRQHREWDAEWKKLKDNLSEIRWSCPGS